MKNPEFHPHHRGRQTTIYQAKLHNELDMHGVTDHHGSVRNCEDPGEIQSKPHASCQIYKKCADVLPVVRRGKKQ